MLVIANWTGLLLLTLALLGLANSVYFTLIYYRVVHPGSGMIPSFCRLGEHTCEAVVFTRYGRLFGVPNSLPGIFFYVLLIYVALTPLSSRHELFLNAALAASTLTIIVGVYLVHALLVRLRTPCPL